MDMLTIMREVNFDWVMRLDSVWRDPPFHVADLNSNVLDTLSAEMDVLVSSGSSYQPLGIVLVGPAGVGKTHLLSTLRRSALDRRTSFVLVDMTDVYDFWDTVLLGYVRSLGKPVHNGRPLFQSILCSIAEAGGVSVEQHHQFLDDLARRHPPQIKDRAEDLVAPLRNAYGHAALEHGDIVRALVLLNSNDISLAGLAYSWLQGLEIEEEDVGKLGFHKKQEPPMRLVKGLSWIMNLLGPSVLCLDQLDAIVTQHHLATMSRSAAEVSDEVNRSRAIIEGIGGGLGALFDATSRTLTVVTCLEGTWEILRKGALVPHMHRYRDAIPLAQISKASQARELIALRLSAAYHKHEFKPSYPTWPFSADAFKGAIGLSPREILKRCDHHRQRFLLRGEIKELADLQISSDQPPEPVASDRLHKRFDALISEQDPTTSFSESAEDELGKILREACRLFVLENPLPEGVDAVVEAEFAIGKGYPSLHCRVRLIFRDEQDREEHYCVRVLQKQHPTSYQARLKAALTASGIDTVLKFRRLVIIRHTDYPSGAKSKQLTEKFCKAGGVFAAPDPEEIRTILAVLALEKEQQTGFLEWLKDRKPLRDLKVMQAIVPALCKQGTEIEHPFPEQPSETESSGQVAAQKMAHVLVGLKLVGSQEQEQLSIPLEVLRKHAVILAGAGSGKTVLVRRIVEEVALLGIPSIVIDCANDLARLGQPWPSPPESWLPGDSQRASDYLAKAQVVLWTPGRLLGNPMVLQPLPELGPLRDEPDELQTAISMVSEAMKEIVARGNTETARQKMGVLNAALHYFAAQGGNGLHDFMELLADLPEEAGGAITGYAKLGRKMADSLRAEIQTDILLRQTGTPLDPAILFGADDASLKTRVSIVNFIGLPDIQLQQRFLNQLAMTLFTWIKKNPCPQDRPMRGLLVIDEAKDFVPSTKSTTCKASIQRLATQGRKYGLGLLFATQSPKDIEHTVIQNCFTQFYGQASSPAAQDVIKDQIRRRGGAGEDIPRLGTGRFYVHCPETMKTPVKVSVPVCLTYHPQSPLTDSEILDLARKSRLSGKTAATL
jgi:hypothetical protein